MEHILQLILQKLDGLETKIDRLDSRVNTLENKIDALEIKVSTLDSKVNTLETKMEGMQSQLNEHTQLMQAIIHRQEETDAKLDSLAMDVHQLHGDVASLKEQAATNTELGQSLQDVINQVDDLKTDVKIIKKVIAS